MRSTAPPHLRWGPDGRCLPNKPASPRLGFFQRQTRFYRAFSLAAGVPPARVPLLQNRCSKSLYTPAAYKIFCTPVFCCGARWKDAAAGRQAAADRMPSRLHRPPGPLFLCFAGKRAPGSAGQCRKSNTKRRVYFNKCKIYLTFLKIKVYLKAREEGMP